MTNELVNTPEIFTNEKFGSVRIVMRDGEPWFVASDVAKALGFANPSDAVNRHCKKTIKTPFNVIHEGGNNPVQINLIPEADVYRLVMRSNVSGAEEFQTWVCEEVLPALRKTGQYSIAQSAPALPDFTNPAEAARAWANEYEAKVQALEQVEALEVALGNARDWKTTTGIPWLNEYFADTSDTACSRIGKFLSALSRRDGVEIRKSPHTRYGTVNVYHVSVIAKLKEILDADANVLKNIRR